MSTHIKFDQDKMKQLHENGLKDHEISEQMGCSKRWVEKWRKTNGLKSNNRRYPRGPLGERIKPKIDTDSTELKDRESLYCDKEFLERLLCKKLDN